MSDRTRLDEVLAPGGVRVVFQPIFEVIGDGVRVHSLECLSRGPKGTSMERADVLFDYVRLKREESAVDRLCIDVALREASNLPASTRLNINVHASTLGRDPGFVRFMRSAAERNAIAMDRVVVEIIEHSPAWDGRSFQAALEALRDAGVAIALDDVGIGHSNYRMILDCRPEYLKIDRYLISGIAQDRARQAVIESIITLARKLGARAVAEGVEHVEDYFALRAVGVHLVQGFLFSGPLTVQSLTKRDLFEIRPVASCSMANTASQN
ncbi:MAG TPA: EAL domain-containing protein [Thermoanaerobaculia bacterium]|nr:EAL domain-containing protein [Thermoanaerobaculia bacterium]